MAQRQLVLVLQGGGALGAYHGGVYESMHEAGFEPDWVIGTSIGAITGAVIAGNAPAKRVERLREFWRQLAQPMAAPWSTFSTLAGGIPGFFVPRTPLPGGVAAPVGVDLASYYSTEPLRDTLARFIDLAMLGRPTRLTVGSVKVAKGEMRYFDSRHMSLSLDHVMASGALPPGFPAVRIDGEAYWDGGLYSNTPMEVVFEEEPRHDSLIFEANVWQPTGPEPDSLWQVLGREKDIRYASRADSHIAREKQIHHLRRVIRELAGHVTPEERAKAHVRKLDAWGCQTTMHVVRLLAPALGSEDYWKDIDFSAAGIQRRWQAGLDDARRMIEAAPWLAPVDPMEGVAVYELSSRTAHAVSSK